MQDTGKLALATKIKAKVLERVDNVPDLRKAICRLSDQSRRSKLHPLTGRVACRFDEGLYVSAPVVRTLRKLGAEFDG